MIQWIPRLVPPLLVGIGYLYEQLAKKGVVVVARVKIDDETGEVTREFVVDSDGAYDEVMDMANTVKRTKHSTNEPPIIEGDATEDGV
jgi:hypothetical protein